MDTNELTQLLATPGVNVLVLTGAGVSAPSGLGTYRGAGGMYQTGQMPPLDARDAKSSRLRLLWEHLGPLAAAGAAATPNAAHRALAWYQQEGPGNLTLATQNVDGLHQRAGARTLELHGSLTRLRCLNPGRWHEASLHGPERDEDGVPRCPECSARMRPDVVLFNEALPRSVWDEAHQASKDADVVLAVGTSLQVHPACDLVAFPASDGTPGAWVDLDPARAREELHPESRGLLQSLLDVPGDVTRTLPHLLGAPQQGQEQD